jgi:acetyl-CoA C-acetyltransferase
LNELQQRHQLDTSKVDDIVLGCVTPIGDQGGDIAKTAAIAAGWMMIRRHKSTVSVLLV